MTKAVSGDTIVEGYFGSDDDSLVLVLVLVLSRCKDVDRAGRDDDDDDDTWLPLTLIPDDASSLSMWTILSSVWISMRCGGGSVEGWRAAWWWVLDCRCLTATERS